MWLVLEAGSPWEQRARWLLVEISAIFILFIASILCGQDCWNTMYVCTALVCNFQIARGPLWGIRKRTWLNEISCVSPSQHIMIHTARLLVPTFQIPVQTSSLGKRSIVMVFQQLAGLPLHLLMRKKRAIHSAWSKYRSTWWWPAQRHSEKNKWCNYSVNFFLLNNDSKKP